jgi:periplasmic protein TonB
MAARDPGSPGIRFARSLVVLHLDPLAPCTPRLPDRRAGALTPLAASTALHVAFVLIAASLASTLAPGIAAPSSEPITDQQGQDVRLVFLVSELPRTGGGGGGGGNQRPEPIRRAQGVGADLITLRVQPRPSPPAPVAAASVPAVEDAPSIPSIVLDAKPLASGFFNQTGLPAGGVLSSPSTGPGSGGGVGTGSGTGIGPGRGPGLGAGSGGGTGGGVYRPGGAVSPPRVIKEVRPKYTSEAMTNKTQGTVLLEAIVTRDGCASQIRVVRSLDAGGLDQEAVAAVAQWRFEPGRLGAAPVDVLVTIDVGFWIR